MRFPQALASIALVSLSVMIAGCSTDKSTETWPSDGSFRNDGAYKVYISKSGSFQNPAFSPSSKSILLTRFRNGYNKGPADLLTVALDSKSVHELVADGSGNINLPGSSWNPITHKIVFSSSREPHDEIFIVDENGSPGDEERITNRRSQAAYEPTLSPDGLWVVFESHQLDIEKNGIIMKYKIDSTGPCQSLTDTKQDCRQPNWSPNGDLILFQRYADRQWDIWTMDAYGANMRKVTRGSGDKTDASFSPDGRWIVYSSTERGIESANLFVMPAEGGKTKRITHYDGYDGAPSWSPDGKKIIFESSPGEPDDSVGTTLWMIDAP